MATILKGKTFINRFDPSLVSGLQLWLDASDSTTLFQDSAATTPAVADGDPVGCWKDKSGYARNATQTDGTKKPLTKKAIKNSRDILRYDGSNDNLTIASTSTFNFLYATQATVFVAFRTNPDIANPNTIYDILDSSSNGGGSGYLLCVDDRGSSGANNALSSYGGGGYPSGTNYYIYPNDSISLGTWSVVANTLKGVDSVAANRTILYVNGVINAATNAYTNSYTGNSTLNMNIGSSGGSWCLNGDIAEIIFYSSALDDTTRTYVQNYLNSKWNVY